MNITEPVNAIETRTRVFPDIPNITTGWKWIDIFNRETLIPTGAYTVYTVSVNGAGTVVSSVGLRVLMTTDTTASNDCNLRLSGMTLVRNDIDNLNFDSRSVITVTITFEIVSTTNSEGAISLINSITKMATLPTTARHMSLVWDFGVDNFWHLVSGDGTTETNDTTSLASNNNNTRKLVITWSGDNAGLLELFASPSDATPVASQIVTAMGNSSTRAYELQILLETLENLAKQFKVHSIEVKVD